jgi:hypothetical protein
MPIIAPNHFAAVLMMYAALPNEDTRNPHVVLLAGLLFDAEIWRDVCALLESRAGRFRPFTLYRNHPTSYEAYRGEDTMMYSRYRT